jgi:hypothetical protein
LLAHQQSTNETFSRQKTLRVHTLMILLDAIADYFLIFLTFDLEDVSNTLNHQTSQSIEYFSALTLMLLPAGQHLHS